MRFLRIKGGFLSVLVEGSKARFRHHAVDGEIVNEVVLERQAEGAGLGS